MANGFEKEPNILSKEKAEPYMTPIEKMVEGMVAAHGDISNWDNRIRTQALTFIYDTLK